MPILMMPEKAASPQSFELLAPQIVIGGQSSILLSVLQPSVNEALSDQRLGVSFETKPAAEGRRTAPIYFARAPGGGTRTTGSVLRKHRHIDGAKDVEGKVVRILVEPPPSSRCPACGGRLLFKLLRAAKLSFDCDNEIFVCEKCGREQQYGVKQSRRMPAGCRPNR